MRQYLDLLRNVVENGTNYPNRTGINARSTFGLRFEHNLQEGFPLLTTKKMPFKSIMAELVGFIRGYSSAKQFRELGTKIWDANANSTPSWINNPHRKGEDDLGPIYGAQWRRWQAPRTLYGDNSTISTVEHIDQLQNLIISLRNNPRDRRHIVSAWNPAILDRVALPPCHVLFQCYVREGFLDLMLFQRSADAALGVPFNIASYAALTHIIAKLTSLSPGRLIINFGDIHIYENHMDGVLEQLTRTPLDLPTAQCAPIKTLEDVTTSTIQIVGYEPLPSIKFDMAA